MKKESKDVTANSDSRFKQLFAAIKANNEIRSLKMALKYLCENSYNSDTGQLREIFIRALESNSDSFRVL